MMSSDGIKGDVCLDLSGFSAETKDSDLIYVSWFYF